MLVKVKVIANLGKDLELPKISDESDKTLDELPTRVVSSIVDVGLVQNFNGY